MNTLLSSRIPRATRPVLLAALALAASLSCAIAWTPGTSNPTAAQGFVVDSSSRIDVLSFYNTIYTASEGYPQTMAWTGNMSTAQAGTTSTVFKEDVRRRINFYRALTGLPADIVFNSAKSAKCQEAALMFSANGAISHYPPTTWTFYTANAAEAAGKSNIFLGEYGAGAVDGFIFDPGSNNARVGHRRWLLYSLAQEMGTGDVPPNGSNNSGNAIWVIGNFKSSAPKFFVAWPNKGFVPQGLVPDRWSLSYPGANFGSATVTMTQNGTSIPVSVVSRSDNGYGDNTIVWEPYGLQVSGAQDVTYSITVSGIGGEGVPVSYSYSITAFNPGVLGQSVTISGPNTSPTSGQRYTFNAISQSDAYQLRVSTGSTTVWSEGAETLNSIINLTSGDYQLAQPTVKRSGSQSFHLAFPSFAAGDQGFEVDRDVVPSATSQLVFYDLFRWVTTGSRLSAEISADSGSTWTEIWGRSGSGITSSSGWDSSFLTRSVSLSAYAGRPVRIRFMFRLSGPTFIGTDTNTGVFLDDISISNATELVNTTTTTLSGSATAFTLNSSTAGAALSNGTKYYLRIRPNVGTKWFGDGPLKTITAQVATPTPNSDFNGDGKPDILWRNQTTGTNVVWLMNGASRTGSTSLPGVAVATGWDIAGSGDFNGDNNVDILWRNNITGANLVWYMNGTTRTGAGSLPGVAANTGWSIAGVGDFNTDGKPDIVWRNSITGANIVWFMNGTARIGVGQLATVAADSGWSIVGVSDFNADGRPDLVWRNTSTGGNIVWFMNGTTRTGVGQLLTVAVGTGWTVQGVGDVNADNKPDLLWRNSLSGANVVWLMNGVTRTGALAIPAIPGAAWRMHN